MDESELDAYEWDLHALAALLAHLWGPAWPLLLDLWETTDSLILACRAVTATSLLPHEHLPER